MIADVDYQKVQRLAANADKRNEAVTAVEGKMQVLRARAIDDEVSYGLVKVSRIREELIHPVLQVANSAGSGVSIEHLRV